jgi:hypothetical protein
MAGKGSNRDVRRRRLVIERISLMIVRRPRPHLSRSFVRRWAAPVTAGAVLLSGGAAAAYAGGMTSGSGSAGGSAMSQGSGMERTAMAGDSSMGQMNGMSTGQMDGMAQGGRTGRGPNEFGLTKGNARGRGTLFTYSHGYFCDTSVAAQSATHCEVGAAARVAPARHTDPLFVIVPLGFTVPMQHCAAALTCVDHPMTLDMTRLAGALAPLFKTTPALLRPSLRNFATPAHDHLLATTAGGRAQWWDVRVIGVTDPGVYQQIRQHASLTFVQSLLRARNPHVLGPIPTNLFLFFAASTR